MEIKHLRGLLNRTTRDGILDGAFTPLTEDILAAPIPNRVRLSKVSLFDGIGDLSDHLGVYSWARAYGDSDTIKCRLFGTTLMGEACRWWYRLPANSITS